jgi:hypothetical protein
MDDTISSIAFPMLDHKMVALFEVSLLVADIWHG